MDFSAGGKLVAEAGQVSAQDPARGALDLLLKGPSQPNHYSEIPKSVRLETLAVKDGTAQVSFDSAFFAAGGSTGIQLRLAQVVFTLTQFPSVTAVQFLQDGQPATATGGEGFPLNRPLTRSSFRALQT